MPSEWGSTGSGVSDATSCGPPYNSRRPGPAATRISDAGPFWEAVAEDQNWFPRYPDTPAPFPRRS